jgi:hypothetical protein
VCLPDAETPIYGSQEYETWRENELTTTKSAKIHAARKRIWSLTQFFSSLLERPAGLRQKIRGFMAQI